ncbi:hypothetical protein VC83_05882 [Pseudogymnoascus destructans]|uniref:Uncharacterized protein n=2 Tax=Pseudogymnoascus destructans TaxID=655981 RepID=L8FWF3_PSED2|nr:uncharacterized protein VC83_05882 [Pseudogymnoascus destructans]ELR04869.1 hypothetical protein GMDG_07094 [Pseudogymnoascus destructans 20631-21]OAF57215.1 hypothetical protein VC83_05882 [Pseudogymnoascus destructans]
MASPNETSADEYCPPPPPNPAADVGLSAQSTTPDPELATPSVSSIDVFKLPPISALKLVCAGIEALVRITGDIPPTPPTSGRQTPNMRGMQEEKENIVRSHSLTDLSKHRRPSIPFAFTAANDEYDGINLRKRPIASLENEQKEPYIIIGANAEPLNLQHNAITRKFYSKRPPPISIEDYLMRIHKFCPMSTGVYLATSVYIHRLAVEGRAIPVTRRNCHRLLLAGLRVAMKALEDLSYPHRIFSKVGGVSENELARLEISFCFLSNFELRTTKEMLLDHALTLKQISSSQGAFGGGHGFDLRLPLGKRSVLSKEGVQEVTADA